MVKGICRVQQGHSHTVSETLRSFLILQFKHLDLLSFEVNVMIKERKEKKKVMVKIVMSI